MLAEVQHGGSKGGGAPFSSCYAARRAAFQVVYIYIYIEREREDSYFKLLLLFLFLLPYRGPHSHRVRLKPHPEEIPEL